MPEGAFLTALIPAYLLMLWGNLKRFTGEPFSYSLSWLIQYVLDMHSLVFFTDAHFWVSRTLLGVLMLAAMVTVSYRWTHRIWVCERDLFLVTALVLTLAFFITPWAFVTQGGGGFLNDRIFIFIPLVLAPWFQVDFHEGLRRLFLTVLVLLSLLQVGRTTYECYWLNEELKTITAGVSRIAPHSAIVKTTSNWLTSKKWRVIQYVSPFANSFFYYALAAHDVVDLDRFAKSEVNPFRFRRFRPQRPEADYVVAIKDYDEKRLANYQRNWDTLYAAEDISVFKRRVPAADFSRWKVDQSGQHQLFINFQAFRRSKGWGIEDVHPFLWYEPGEFGWVNRKKREAQANLILPAKHQYPDPVNTLWRTYLEGEEESAFRLDLPNGVYQVTLYFYTAHTGNRRVTLLANDRVILKNMAVPAYTPIIKRYTVTVQNGQLTQLIDAPPGQTWILNGFQVAEIPAVKGGN